MLPEFSAFIDESSAKRSGGLQEYLVCAAVIQADKAEEVREKLLPLKLKGQIKLHWSDEDEPRRRKIVSAISQLAPMNAVVTHVSQPQKKTERFRRKCLETLYYELSGMGVQQVTCESRMPSQDKKDVAHLLTLRNQKFIDPEFDITHQRGGDEPLLWIPDIVLGAINANHSGISEHYEALKGLLIYDEKTPTSL